jgi:predicted metalloendopeptidase
MTYNVVSRPFLHHMQARLRSWSLDRWRGWFALLVGQWIAGMAPPGPLRSAWFAYNRIHLQGIKVDETPAALRMSIVQALLPNTVGRLWVRDHCSPTTKRAVGAMAENIRAAAAAALAKTSWMAPSTRTAAVRKVQHLDIEICWPPMDDWPTAEPACALTPDSYVRNIMGLSAAATDFNINQRDCRHPSGNGWSRPVFEVNAFYYPDENRFLLPAAILRPPFYDPKQSIPWNYGGIGATIGHELCHAFDAEGRSYDHRGDRRNWWTRGDAKEYRARALRVVRLFQTRKYRGMPVSGTLTLIENIADLGGLEFSLAGARRALGRALTKEELREFFESYAVSWRAKDRRERAAELLARDPHAPPMLRVNHAVRQLDEWYEAYDVDPSCPDYIAPDQRVHFFV